MVHGWRTESMRGEADIASDAIIEQMPDRYLFGRRHRPLGAIVQGPQVTYQLHEYCWSWLSLE